MTMEKPKGIKDAELADAIKKHEEKLGIDINVVKKLNEFGISGEESEKIAGFRDLTKEQQFLVLENLKQLTLGRIEEEAAEKYKKNTAEAKILGRLWQNISKNYQIAKLEKEAVKNIKSGGLLVHGEVLKQLINGVKELGLDVVAKKDGKLEIQYAAFKDLNEEEKREVNYFNERANEFSRLPYEWSLDTATKEQQRRYKQKEENYKFARNIILNLKKEKKGSEKDAAIYMNDIDAKIHYNQFLNNHPDIEKQFQEITDKNILARAFANIVTERGIYAASGFIVRSATISLVGLAAVPLAAAGMGGVMSFLRAKKSLKEREMAARKGEKEKSETAKNFVDADNLSERIDYFMKRINSESDEGEKIKLINSLKTRIEYTQDKLNDGLVNFGMKDKRLKNQLDLIQKISQAGVLAVGLRDGQSVIKERLEKFLELKEKKISESQKNYIRSAVIRGALMGAGFAVAGYTLRHYGESLFDWFKNSEEISEAAKKAVGIIKAPEKTFLLSGFNIEVPKDALTIGSRGPEGAIIDYLKSQGMSVDKAGAEAHKIFLNYMKEHGVVDKEGFAEIMRYIKQGGVLLDSEGKMELVDMKYTGAVTFEGGTAVLRAGEHAGAEGAVIPETVKSEIADLKSEIQKAKRDLLVAYDHNFDGIIDESEAENASVDLDKIKEMEAKLAGLEAGIIEKGEATKEASFGDQEDNEVNKALTEKQTVSGVKVKPADTAVGGSAVIGHEVGSEESYKIGDKEITVVLKSDGTGIIRDAENVVIDKDDILKNLKQDYADKIIDKKIRINNFVLADIDNFARNIEIYRRLLESSNLSSSQVGYLKSIMNQTIKVAEEKYGDIFEDDIIKKLK